MSLRSLILISVSFASLFNVDIVYSNDLNVSTDDVSAYSFGQNLGEVVSSTKTVLPIRKSPNAVSIIENKTLTALGINNLADIFRLVPGFRVAVRSGNDRSVTYHGNNAILPRRLQILIDSKPLLRSSYATLRWDRIPLNINQVERIEVVRGATTATHGTSAFLATINIITKIHSPEAPDKIKVLFGGEETNEIYVSKAYEKFTFEASYHEDDGFDNFRDNTYKGIASIKYLGENLNVNASFMDAHFQNESNVYSDSVFTTLDYDQKHSFIHADYIKPLDQFNSFRVNLAMDARSYRTEFGACVPYFSYWEDTIALGQLIKKEIARSDLGNVFQTGVLSLNETLDRPVSVGEQVLLDRINQRMQSESIPRSFADVCGYTNQDHDEYSAQTEFQHIFSNDENLSLINFIGFNYTDLKSESWLAGNVYSSNAYAASNVIFTVLNDEDYDLLTFNFGVRAEWPDLEEDTSFVSYRFGTNFHLDAKNTLRVLFAKSYRTPDVYETERKWRYFSSIDDDLSEVKGVEDEFAYFYAESPEHLKPEKLRSIELGWHYTRKNETRFDLKVFYNELDQLISEPFYFLDFNLTNSNGYILKGSEIDFSQVISRVWSVRSTLSYIDNGSRYVAEQSNHSDWAGSITNVIKLSKGKTLGLGYMGSDRINGIPFDRYFINLRKKYHLGESAAYVGLMLSEETKEYRFIDDLLTFTFEPEYKKEYHLMFSLEYQY